MALSYELTDIEDYKQKCLDPSRDSGLTLTTQALIFVTMAVGMGKITKDNVVEFAGRCYMHERINTPMRYGPAPDHAPVFITLAECEAHIGLRTNVSAIPRHVWCPRLLGAVMSEISWKKNQPS